MWQLHDKYNLTIDGRWEALLKLYKNIHLILLHECSASLLCWREGFLIVAMASGVGMASPGGSWRIMFSCAAGGNFDPLIFALVILYSPESKYLFWNNNVLRFNAYWISDFTITCVYLNTCLLIQPRKGSSEVHLPIFTSAWIPWNQFTDPL